MAILTGDKWYLIVDLICVSFTINNIEHLFIAYWPSDSVFFNSMHPSHGWRF